MTALLLAFGVNLGIFTATYNQQTRVDAELTLGADVVVTAPPGAVAQHGLQNRIEQVNGVSGASAVDHSYAYVGPDLQDTFGIDARTFTSGTSLRDSYFIGGSASQMLSRLRARPDGILVSKETVTDYSLARGDLLKLRVLDRRSGSFRIAPFHVVGIVQEFPSAPRDSFMVANLSYLHAVTHDQGPNLVFVKAAGDPAGVLDADRRLDPEPSARRSRTSASRPFRRRARSRRSTSPGSAESKRHSRSCSQRRRSACSSSSRSPSAGTSSPRWPRWEPRCETIAAFVWSEAALVVGAALACAALLGWLLAKMLVAMLQHVFDPPPTQLAIPWAFLGELAGAAVLGGALAVAVASRGLARLRLGSILREE